MLEERNASQPIDYETIYKHVQQLNELIADGSEVRNGRNNQKHFTKRMLEDGELL